MHSNLGCGTMGYLVLTASPAVYTLMYAVPFVAHVNPGATHIIPDPPPTAAAIYKLTRTHTENMRIFREYKSIHVTCKKVIMNLVGEVYYRTLKNRYTGYTTRS